MFANFRFMCTRKLAYRSNLIQPPICNIDNLPARAAEYLSGVP